MLYVFYRNKIIAKVYLYNDLKNSNNKFVYLDMIIFLYYYSYSLVDQKQGDFPF